MAVDKKNIDLKAGDDNSFCDDFDKEQSAGYLVNYMARLFAQALHKGIKPLGLSPGQFPVLLELWSGDGLTQRELVERIAVEQATIANTLTRMERDGLIVRRTHPKDRRAQSIYLTNKAKDLEKPAIEAAIAVNQMAYSGLSESKCRQFIDLAQGIIGALRRD